MFHFLYFILLYTHEKLRFLKAPPGCYSASKLAELESCLTQLSHLWWMPKSASNGSGACRLPHPKNPDHHNKQLLFFSDTNSEYGYGYEKSEYESSEYESSEDESSEDGKNAM